jgi:hypothetical protein
MLQLTQSVTLPRPLPCGAIVSDNGSTTRLCNTPTVSGDLHPGSERGTYTLIPICPTCAGFASRASISPTDRERLEYSDPTLPENMEELIEMANELGAKETWIIRYPRAAMVRLAFLDSSPPDYLQLTNPVATLLLLHFPAGDGGAPGIERR